MTISNVQNFDKEQHVEVLLNDLDIFKRELDADTDSPRFYSLQPLVVKKTVPGERENELLESLRAADGIEKAEELFDKYREWEVIDGYNRHLPRYNFTYNDVLHCPLLKMGHGFVLAMLLEGVIKVDEGGNVTYADGFMDYPH